MLHADVLLSVVLHVDFQMGQDICRSAVLMGDKSAQLPLYLFCAMTMHIMCTPRTYIGNHVINIVTSLYSQIPGTTCLVGQSRMVVVY